MNQLREDLIATARRMSELGLTPGMSGNASVRTPTGGMLVTPSGMPYAALVPDDAVEIRLDGAMRAGQRTPTSEWQLHRDIFEARSDVQAVVHTHSLFCTTISCLRREIPAIHYMVVLAGSDAIPCAEYATFGSAELARNVVSALGSGNACLLANHGMVALGSSLAQALRLAAEVETLAAQYWHAAQLGAPHILDGEELQRVRARFAGYGQPEPPAKRPG
ncbi:MAG TPA: class II aldolase/adducin family protein [Kofleriaceae bacterium]|jgi:L-fuculose-phosphate aldolase|nr:class II aldolase/adducin family protein [Kofleriaceae bacterium]